jgi:phosphotransferase system enzyme I (PtsP)
MEYLDLFRDQLRAIMLAIKEGYRFRILLPLVTHVWEVETAHEIIEEISEEIGLPYADIPPLGIMMEVPALVYQLVDFKDLIDFVSIGTNDLIQYMLAVDRNSNLVGHLYSSFHPSVMRVLGDIFVKTQALGKEVTICGEMAGTPLGALALLALGYRKLSVLPSRAPIIRHLVRRVDEDLLQNVKYAILSEKRETSIETYLRETLARIDPKLSELE